jgi:hypothetical protein
MHTGSDTLGGSFSISENFCWDPSHPNGSLIFDYEGTLTYLLTGEEATIHVGEWVETQDANCIVAPEPIKLTLDGFTGEHAGGRFKGHVSYVNDHGPCSGLDVPSISWWQGVFTPNAPGQ